MSLYKTTFVKLEQRDTHCRERSMPLLNAVSNRGHNIPSTITPAVLEIHVQLQEYPLCWHLNSQGLTKAKRVSDPLNKAVRENLCGNSADHVDKLERETPYSTTGSDHDIVSMAPGFLEEQNQNRECSHCPRPDLSDDCGSDAERSGVNLVLGEQIREMVQGVSCICSRQEQMLLQDVTQALRMAKEKAGLLTENNGQKSCLRRFVMSRLRCAGYNAGICKSRWEKTNGYPAGDYEFIDVVVEGSRSMAGGDRFLVDIDFRAQFEIARPTEDYDALVEVLPILFVGRADKMRQMIRIMCDAARRSLKTKGMHIPPWRKARYMQAKWVGPYKRTTDPISTSHRQGEYAAMAALKSAGMGMGWDASFNHQMQLYFQEAMRETNNPAVGKLKTQLQELEVARDVESWQLQGKCRLAVATESSSIIKSRVRDQVKFSGLATAIAEAARRK